MGMTVRYTLSFLTRICRKLERKLSNDIFPSIFCDSWVRRGSGWGTLSRTHDGSDNASGHHDRKQKYPESSNDGISIKNGRKIRIILCLVSFFGPFFLFHICILDVSNILRIFFTNENKKTTMGDIPHLSHSNLTKGGYICPRCSAKVCFLPTECPCCALTLILSTHLARSYHHLFPLKNWVEVPWSK